MRGVRAVRRLLNALAVLHTLCAFLSRCKAITRKFICVKRRGEQPKRHTLLNQYTVRTEPNRPPPSSPRTANGTHYLRVEPSAVDHIDGVQRRHPECLKAAQRGGGGRRRRGSKPATEPRPDLGSSLASSVAPATSPASRESESAHCLRASDPLLCPEGFLPCSAPSNTGIRAKPDNGPNKGHAFCHSAICVNSRVAKGMCFMP